MVGTTGGCYFFFLYRHLKLYILSDLNYSEIVHGEYDSYVALALETGDLFLTSVPL